MSLAQTLLAEFEAQAPITRKFLERLPEDKLTWKPHDKSMSAGQLALHIAQVPGGVVRLASQNEANAPDFKGPRQPENVNEILSAFDESISTVRATLPNFDESSLNETWRLMANGKELFAVPRSAMLRNTMLNHWYQHRGQLSVYLRILDVPVPSSFGPSADEQPAFAQSK